MNQRFAVTLIIVTGTRIALLGLWFAALLMAYRAFGEDDQGLAQAGMFATAVAAIKVMTACIGDALDLAVMRRVPLLHQTAPATAVSILRAGLLLRLAGAALIAALAAVLAGPAAAAVFHDAGHAGIVRLAAAGVVAELLYRGTLVYFQSREAFRPFLGLEAALQVGRVVAIVALIQTGALDAYTALGAYVAVSFAVAVAGFIAVPRSVLRLSGGGWHELADTFHYVKWMVGALVIAALYEKLDLFMLGVFHGPEAAGLYGAVLTLAMIPEVVGSYMATVLQPRVMRFYRSGRFTRFTRWFMLAMAPPALLALAVVILFGEPLVALVLGERYLPALPALTWLMAGLLTWLVVTPLPMALVALVTPRAILKVTSTQLVLMVAGGLALIPSFGVTGAAMLICVVRVAVALWLLWLARGVIRRGEPVPDADQDAGIRDPLMGAGAGRMDEVKS